MRRTILLVFAALLALALVAPAATATPKEAKGCPAEPSVWTLVEFGLTPYTENTFYEFYFVTYPDAAAAFAEANGWVLPEDEAIAYAAAEEMVASIDRNGDFQFCTFWIGGNPGLEDYWISVVDNNSNANH